MWVNYIVTKTLNAPAMNGMINGIDDNANYLSDGVGNDSPYIGEWSSDTPITIIVGTYSEIEEAMQAEYTECFLELEKIKKYGFNQHFEFRVHSDHSIHYQPKTSFDSRGCQWISKSDIEYEGCQFGWLVNFQIIKTWVKEKESKEVMYEDGELHERN